MEVHHHPHVEKKKFKEYFLEFLMIFFAVTLGFFAENIRETLTERHNAKEYAEITGERPYRDIAEFNRTGHILKKNILTAETVFYSLARLGDNKKSRRRIVLL